MKLLREIIGNLRLMLAALLGCIIWLASNDAGTVKSNLSTWFPESLIDMAPLLQAKAFDYWIICICVALLLVVLISWLRVLYTKKNEAPPSVGISVTMGDGNKVNQIGHSSDGRRKKDGR